MRVCVGGVGLDRIQFGVCLWCIYRYIYIYMFEMPMSIMIK